MHHRIAVIANALVVAGLLPDFFHWLSLLWQSYLFDNDQRYGRSRQLRGANSFILEYFSRKSLFLKDVEGSLAITQ
jgi:hypothetical protein